MQSREKGIGPGCRVQSAGGTLRMEAAYFSEHNALKVHPCCHKRQDFLFFL